MFEGSFYRVAAPPPGELHSVMHTLAQLGCYVDLAVRSTLIDVTDGHQASWLGIYPLPETMTAWRARAAIRAASLRPASLAELVGFYRQQPWQVAADAPLVALYAPVLTRETPRKRGWPMVMRGAIGFSITLLAADGLCRIGPHYLVARDAPETKDPD